MVAKKKKERNRKEEDIILGEMRHCSDHVIFMAVEQE